MTFGPGRNLFTGQSLGSDNPFMPRPRRQQAAPSGFAPMADPAAASFDPANPTPAPTMGAPLAMNRAPVAADPVRMPTISSPAQGFAHLGSSIFDGIEDRRQNDHRVRLAGALLGDQSGGAANPQTQALANALAGNAAAFAPMPVTSLGEALGFKAPTFEDQIGAVRGSLADASPWGGYTLPAADPLTSDLSTSFGQDDPWIFDALSQGW